MGKWKMVRLGDSATFINGFAFKPADWSNEGLPIIRIQNLTGSSEVVNYYNGPYNAQYEVNNGDILISWSASLGVYEWSQGKALLNQHIFKVIFDKLDYDKRFFMYVISQKLGEMSAATHGSTMKHITKKYFDAIMIPLPPLDVQQKIADVLDKASALIELRRAQLDKLDLLIKSQFIEMFGDPATNPNDWPIGTIREIVREVRYGSSRPAVDGGKYPYLRMNNITYNGELDLTDIKRIDVPVKELPKCTVQRGDVLFNRTNSKELVGKTCLYNRDEMMVLAGFVIRVRMNQKALPEFLVQFLNLDYSKQTLLGMCKAAIGQANINAQELQNIAIYIPPLELQRQFVDLKEQVDKSKFALKQSLSKLEFNYKSLMQKCFRDEVF